MGFGHWDFPDCLFGSGLSGLGKRHDRWLELYVADQIDMNRLKEEQETINAQQLGLEQEREALQSVLSEAANADKRIQTFHEFCSTISGRLYDLSFHEKRSILHLLNIDGRVSEGHLYLSGRIPTWEHQEAMFAYRPSESDQLP